MKDLFEADIGCKECNNKTKKSNAFFLNKDKELIKPIELITYLKFL